MNTHLIFADEIKVGDTIRREKATKNYTDNTEYPNPWYTVTSIRTSEHGGNTGFSKQPITVSVHTIGVDEEGTQVSNTTISTYVWERKDFDYENINSPYAEYLKRLGFLFK